MTTEKQQIDAVLAEFGERVGMGPLSRDDEGVCQLAFDESTVVNIGFNPANENVVLFSPVGELPPQDREAVLTRLLKANLFWQETGGATLAVDPAADVVMLAYQFPQANLDIVQFEALIEWFVANAEAWSASLSDSAAGNGSGADGTSADGWNLAGLGMKV